jgi:hypothetical protein
VSEQLIRQFVDLLYPPTSRLPEGARFSLWEMPTKKSYHYRLNDPELEIAAYALDREGHNVFCGVGLRRIDFGPFERGKKEDIVALPGFWADVDIRGLNHAADNLPANVVDIVHGILAPFDWEPSAVVNSGGGIHAYWLFEQPLLVGKEIGGVDRAEVEEMSRAFQERLAMHARAAGWKWDMTADLPRVLRPVGTHNRKGDPVPVEFMGTPGGTRYPYNLFQAALRTKASGIAAILGRDTQAPIPATPDRPGAPTVPTRVVDQRTPEQILDDLRTKMRRNRNQDRAELFRMIREGEPFAVAGERDRTLQKVASLIGFFDCVADPEILAEILRPSLEAMAEAQPEGAMTFEDAVDKIARAQNDARRKNAISEGAQERIKKALIAQARGLIKKLPKPADLVVVPEPPTPAAKPVDSQLPLDQILGARVPALAVLPGTAEQPTSGNIDPDSYSEDEIKGFISRQAQLCGCEISMEDWKKRWIIVHGDTLFIFSNGKYLAPIPTKNFRVSSHRDLAPLPARLGESEAYYYNPITTNSNTGLPRRKTNEEVFDEIATVARHLVADMAIDESYYDPDTQTFYEAVCPLRTDLKPRFDARIQKWLELLGGEDVEKLLDWIATVTYLKAPSCGLFLSGPPDTGKSLLANGLARLWHTGGYTRMEEVVGAFNADLAKCPLVVADETLPEGGNGKPISTKRLRDIISADTRALKRKHMSNASLTGTIRCMFLANSANLLAPDEEILGPDSLNAVASRFLHVVVPKEASEYLASLGGRHGGTSQWIVGDLIAQHALWLRDNRKVVAAGRFWVAGHLNKMHQSLATSAPLNGQVIEWIIRYLLKPKPEVKAARGVLAGNGELWVNGSTITDYWAEYMKNKSGPPPLNKVAKVLQGLVVDNGRSSAEGGRVIRTDRGTKRYWGLRVQGILLWASGHGFDESELGELISRKVEETFE